MSFKRVTTSAKKLPIDWETQGENMSYRVAALCKIYGTPLELVVNTDQTGIFLVPNAGGYVFSFFFFMKLIAVYNYMYVSIRTTDLEC